MKIQIPLAPFNGHELFPVGGFRFEGHSFVSAVEAEGAKFPAKLEFKSLSIQKDKDGNLFLEVES